MTEHTTTTPSGAAARLREDLLYGLEHIVFTSVLGSPLLPRVARRAMLLAAGARVGSGPGIGFALAGSARNLTIGHGVFCNKRVSIEAIAPVVIGDDTSIGMDVLIITSHHGFDEAGQWSRTPEGRAVRIGQRVWIGARATILPGTVIEDDVVVAAGAVVRGRLRSGGVYGGVPAKRIRELGPTPQVAGPEASAPSERVVRVRAR